MKHLTGMDASFLHLESPQMPMHVGSMMVLDLPAGHSGDFYEDAERFLSGRLHLAEVFERKLALMPFDLANPVWVHDDEVDLDYHVRHVMLPRPGTREQLEKYVARLHSSLLDRSRPLWELYVIEGLKSGQVAIYNKVHHATIDGQAGVALTKALLTDSPNAPPVKAPRRRTRGGQGSLGMAELAGAALSNAVVQFVKLAKALPKTAKAIGSVLLPASLEEAKRRLSVLRGWRRAPRTPLNVALTNQRSFAARSLPLAEVKQMAKASGTGLNDIVLAICAGALKRYLAEYDCKPAQPLVAAVPVSLRDAGNQEMSNQVTMIIVSLATHIDDPIERLEAIKASSSVGKALTGSLKAVIPNDFPSLGAPWLTSGLASLYGRSGLADKLPPIVNVAISNVPGPQFPLYFAGAKVAEWYPVSIPTHGVALNITVQSYNGALEVGLTACRRAMPDVADLGQHVVEEHKKLLALIASRVAALPAAQPESAAAVSVARTARARKPRTGRAAPRKAARTAAAVVKSAH